jgi:hypothetical protein
MIVTRIRNAAMSRLSTAIAGTFVVCGFLAVSAACFGQEATQVWLINTRCAPDCGDLEAGLARITYSRLSESPSCSQWQSSDAAAFQTSAAASVPTIVLVHGNDSDAEWAVRHGNELHRLLKQQACARPYRLVVWSWPADRILRRNRLDVQIKVCRSDVEAYYLARVLPKVPQGAPLSLIGYSLGCRTVCGALTLLTGGSAAGRSLAPEAVNDWKISGPRPTRMMLIAAAMDAASLEPCSSNGLALSGVERVVVSKNGCDHVLKWYSRLYGRQGPEAMGYAGPASTLGGKMEIVDVSGEIGREHDFDRYMESSPVFQRLGWYTFLCNSVKK